MIKYFYGALAFVAIFSFVQTYFVYDEPEITYKTVMISSNGQIHEYEVDGVNVRIK